MAPPAMLHRVLYRKDHWPKGLWIRRSASRPLACYGRRSTRSFVEMKIGIKLEILPQGLVIELESSFFVYVSGEEQISVCLRHVDENLEIYKD